MSVDYTKGLRRPHPSTPRECVSGAEWWGVAKR